jgi:hypothetical protein
MWVHSSSTVPELFLFIGSNNYYCILDYFLEFAHFKKCNEVFRGK